MKQIITITIILFATLTGCKKGGDTQQTPATIRLSGIYISENVQNYSLPVLYTSTGTITDTSFIRDFIRRRQIQWTPSPPLPRIDTMFKFSLSAQPFYRRIQIVINGDTGNISAFFSSYPQGYANLNQPWKFRLQTGSTNERSILLNDSMQVSYAPPFTCTQSLPTFYKSQSDSSCNSFYTTNGLFTYCSFKKRMPISIGNNQIVVPMITSFFQTSQGCFPCFQKNIMFLHLQLSYQDVLKEEILCFYRKDRSDC